MDDEIHGIIAAMTGAAIDTSILHRLLESDEPFSPEVARYFLGLKLSETDLQQIHDLSEKANEGDLSSEEREQLLTYLILNDILVIVQSRARVALKNSTPAA